MSFNVPLRVLTNSCLVGKYRLWVALTHIMPNPFHGVEFGTVLGQRDQMKPVAILSQPGLTSVVVIGGVILNQEDLSATAAAGYAIEEGGVGLAVEHRFAQNEL